MTGNSNELLLYNFPGSASLVGSKT